MPSRLLHHRSLQYRNRSRYSLLKTALGSFRAPLPVVVAAAAFATHRHPSSHAYAYAFPSLSSSLQQHQQHPYSHFKQYSSVRAMTSLSYNDDDDSMNPIIDPNSFANLTTLDDLLQQPTSNTSTNSTNPQPFPSPLLKSLLSRTIPPLTPNSHKGSSGRIAIIGGSPKYTGAPYYAAMASLRSGMDLVTVHCAQEASGPIKCYSPELMVDPFYSNELLLSLEERTSSTTSNSGRSTSRTKMVKEMVQHISPSLMIQGRIHALVIGPGLGRDAIVMEAVAQIIRVAIRNGINLVLDADALYLLTLVPYQGLLEEELAMYSSSLSSSSSSSRSSSKSHVVLTPNVVEYQRLVDSIGGGSEERLRKKLHGVILIVKGQFDTIEECSHGDMTTTTTTTDGTCISTSTNQLVKMECRQVGGMKRSGGIGDILAGIVGSFLAWNQIIESTRVKKGDEVVVEQEEEGVETTTNLILSCWFACALAKRATKVAFDKRRRSMTAPDILEEVGMVMDEYTSCTILDEIL